MRLISFVLEREDMEEVGHVSKRKPPGHSLTAFHVLERRGHDVGSLGQVLSLKSKALEELQQFMVSGLVRGFLFFLFSIRISIWKLVFGYACLCNFFVIL